MSAMDLIRSKKRGFFSVSNTEIPTNMTRKKVKPTASVNSLIFSKMESTRNDLDSSTSSTNSSPDGDTGSSCDDINIASRKLKTFAKKSIRRDKKKEKDKLERKEKNKISMDDYLCKQLEFHMWLEEEKNKQPKEMSSPKLKRYFKVFLKLWNKKKLPQRFFRGLSNTDSPCPSRSSRVINFLEDTDNQKVVGFTRPKSKRLSVEPCGLLESPFSTFGKIPPKQGIVSSLHQLDTPKLVMSFDSSVDEDGRQKGQNVVTNDVIELGEYQTPLNALTECQKENVCPLERHTVPYKKAAYPNPSEYNEISLKDDITDQMIDSSDDVVKEMSPVYAVPWKPKCKKKERSTPDDSSSACQHSPSPPPVPPPLYKLEMSEEMSQNTSSNHCKVGSVQESVTPSTFLSGKNEAKFSSEGSVYQLKNPDYACSSSEYACPDELDIYSSVQCAKETHVTVQPKTAETHNVKNSRLMDTTECPEPVYVPVGNGWHDPVKAKVMKPSVASKTSYPPLPDNHSRQVPPEDDTEMAQENQQQVNNTEISPSPDTGKADESGQHPATETFHSVTCTNKMQRSVNFSFSKYLITPEKKKTNINTSKSRSAGSSNDRMKTRLIMGSYKTTHPTSTHSGQSRDKEMKGDGTASSQNITQGRKRATKFNITMKVTDGLMNQRDFVLYGGNKKEKNLNCVTDTKSTTQNTFENPDFPYCKPVAEKVATSAVTGKRLIPSDYLETDIDTTPVPMMGSKTPPRQRRQLSSLPRTKSLETIIW